MQPYFLGGGSTASRLSMRSMDSIALGVVPKSRPQQHMSCQQSILLFIKGDNSSSSTTLSSRSIRVQDYHHLNMKQ
jgi:hypothetical protein